MATSPAAIGAFCSAVGASERCDATGEAGKITVPAASPRVSRLAALTVMADALPVASMLAALEAADGMVAAVAFC